MNEPLKPCPFCGEKADILPTPDTEANEALDRIEKAIKST